MLPLDVAGLVADACARKKYAYWLAGAKDFDLFLFAVRGDAPVFSNLFDDRIGCLWRENGEMQAALWEATTDPGKPYKDQPLRPDGTAVLEEGQTRKLWKLGRHKDQYEALVQASPVMYRRIPKGGGPYAPRTTGLIGANCHKAGTNSPTVDWWSAACQVHKRSTTFERMMTLARKQKEVHGWEFVSYTLFGTSTSPELRALFHVPPTD